MILQSFICLVILYKIISHQFFTSILQVCHCFLHNGESRSLPSFILYDVLNLNFGSACSRTPSSHSARTSGDCDQTWRERGTSWYVAFGIFKRFWQTRALGQCFATFITHGTPNNFLNFWHTSSTNASNTLHYLLWVIGIYFNEHNRCTLGLIFERATPTSLSTSFKHGSLLINNKDEELCSHKHVVQSPRRIATATSEIRLYISLIQIQNSSSGTSLTFNLRVLYFVVQECFFLTGKDDSCVDISQKRISDPTRLLRINCGKVVVIFLM